MTLAVHRLTLLATTALFVAGCASQPVERIPHYPTADPATTLQAMREQSAKLQSATGKGTVTLSSPDRGEVRLDSVFVLRPPGHARIRAWKFNQAVFDLTVRPDGVWVYVPREGTKPGQITDSTRGAGDAIRQWLTYFGGSVAYEGADIRADARTITITKRTDDQLTLTTQVDRATRTIRSLRLTDTSDVQRFRMTMADYQTFGDAVWPTRVTAYSDRGTIVVETRELQPNVAADTAFNPPPRATALK